MNSFKSIFQNPFLVFLIGCLVGISEAKDFCLKAGRTQITGIYGVRGLPLLFPDQKSFQESNFEKAILLITSRESFTAEQNTNLKSGDAVCVEGEIEFYEENEIRPYLAKLRNVAFLDKKGRKDESAAASSAPKK